MVLIGMAVLPRQSAEDACATSRCLHNWSPEVIFELVGGAVYKLFPSYDRKAVADAAHIALAAVHGMDFLLTWNCAHIANAVVAKAVAKVCWQYDWDSPLICTPEELF